MDGLGAVNVYAIETDDGLTLIDGGWSIQVARDLLERCLRDIGYGFGDIRRFLVTHATATTTRSRPCWGTRVRRRGRARPREKPGLDLLNDALRGRRSWSATRSSTCSAPPVPTRSPGVGGARDLPDPAWWQYPHTWLTGDQQVEGRRPHPRRRARPGTRPVTSSSPTRLPACSSPATTCCRPSRRRSGFTVPPVPDPLGDFMASLTKVGRCPTCRSCRRTGRSRPSTHARVDRLIAHHEERLQRSLAALAAGPLTG